MTPHRLFLHFSTPIQLTFNIFFTLSVLLFNCICYFVMGTRTITFLPVSFEILLFLVNMVVHSFIKVGIELLHSGNTVSEHKNC